MRLSARSPRRLAAALGLALVALTACRPARPGAGPAIVVITLEGLRPDALGVFGGPSHLAPALDRFAAEADWAGVAVAAAGAPGPALVSLLTGLPPHQHGSWSAGRPRLQAELDSLAEGLRRAAYRTAAYREGDLVRRQQSLAQGFDIYEPANPRERVLAALRTLRPEGDFLWLHSSLPGGEPLVLRERFRDRLENPPADLPRRLRPSEAGDRAQDGAAWRALYESNVAQADLEAGEMLAELRDHGPWDRTLVVVVGVTGWNAAADRGRAGSLDRAQLEVPLLIKLPRGFARPLPAKGERVAAARLLATLLEAAGTHAVPAAAPSLFRTAEAGALSERFGGNGVNEFSWLAGDLRLLRTVHFAAAEEEYEAARARSGRKHAAPATSEPARRILRRLNRAFLRTPPYTGLSHETALERWLPGGAIEPVVDPQATARLGAELDRAYFAFIDQERAPARDESPGE
jgi:arylsulfatase A-like enzyme